MKVENLHIVYFIGIGGIGMSALARWFNMTGNQVCGYDRTPTPLTKQLEQEGIAISYEDKIETLPSEILKFNQNALIVYTPAIPPSHQQYNFLLKLGYEAMKRSAVLGLITQDKFTIAIAGTHGKTTTSSMIAHLLVHAGKKCHAFLGGITVNYETNLIVTEDQNGAELMVVEADEYDRSFLTLNPNIAVITSADADHLDIYGDANAMQDSFKAFIDKIERKGQLFINESIAPLLLEEKNQHLQVRKYAWDGNFTFAKNIEIDQGEFVFDYQGGDKVIEGFRLKVPGYHNLENAIAAISIADSLGIDQDKIKEGIISYTGVKRRFEYIIKSNDLIVIDDYAHHPVELKALLQSARALFPNKKVSILFQPHLFSRTRDFAEGFADSLSMADEVLLLDIYPARELPIQGVTSDIIFNKLKSNEKKKCTLENAVNLISKLSLEVLIIAGAGNIDQLIEPIKSNLIENDHVE